MAIKNSSPMRFSPAGLTDAFDASDVFPGACQQMQNLILGQTDPSVLTCRPGVVTLSILSALGMANPTFISVQSTAGSRIFGMVSTTTNPGKDEPFIYDTATNSLVAISGITAGNTPTSPVSNGVDWTPPTIASVGVYVIVTHPGFNGSGSNFFGVFDLTNPAAPAWSANNTTTNTLPAVPVAVANFNDRAWFALGTAAYQNQMWYTDALLLSVTASTQFLVIGDSGAINALSGLPMSTTSSGVLGALTVFKQTQIWQINGDTTTTNLAQNFLSLTVGTTMPRSVAQGTLGLYFISSAGPYYLNPFGALLPISHNLQNLDPDVQTPFQNAITPTRWCGAYNTSVYRICGPTVVNGFQATADYWFDEHARRWSGPHSFAYDCASTINDYFVLTSFSNPGLLIRSDPQSELNSVYTDLGSPYNFLLLSSTFPRTNDMVTKQVVQSQIELGGLPTTAQYTIQGQDDQGTVLAQVTFTVGTGKNWGSFLWGDGSSWSSGVANGGGVWGGGGLWGSAAQGGSNLLWSSSQVRPVHTYPVQWPNPLNFEKMQLSIAGIAAKNVQIGTFYAQYQRTGWMTQG